MPRLPTLSLCLLLTLPLGARALCTSDGLAPPQALLERFTSADCADCWRDAATPAAAANTLALDWVVPGRKGDDAPLSVVASGDAPDRLAALRQPAPERTSAFTSLRAGPQAQLRVAQGAAINDYLGTSIALKAPGREPWRAWLLLVERLPAGTEGSPVARNLVRNVFRPDWEQVAGRGRGGLEEARAMQIHAGAQPDRLRLVAVLQDSRGRIRAIRQTECP